MAGKLDGKVAIVTGASKGIGAGVAEHLAAAGAAVAVNYASSRSGADEVVGRIKAAGGKAVAVQADVSKPDHVKRLFAESAAALGRPSVLVNNAGVYDFAPIDAITPEHYHKHFDLNVLGLILATQEAVRHFGDGGGSVVNISSTVTRLVIPAMSIYTATKAAVDSLTRSLAAELGAKKIRVNAVNPGVVETPGNPMASDTEDPMYKQIIAKTPLGRVGRPDDIAPAVLYFASDDSQWVTGEILFVSGGLR